MHKIEIQKITEIYMRTIIYKLNFLCGIIWNFVNLLQIDVKKTIKGNGSNALNLTSYASKIETGLKI